MQNTFVKISVPTWSQNAYTLEVILKSLLRAPLLFPNSSLSGAGAGCRDLILSVSPPVSLAALSVLGNKLLDVAVAIYIW